MDKRGVCVFITGGPSAKLCARGEGGDIGGHVGGCIGLTLL
jgi:hypothetical protein